MSVECKYIEMVEMVVTFEIDLVTRFSEIIEDRVVNGFLMKVNVVFLELIDLFMIFIF